MLAVRELADHPKAFGTSRHVTQGLADRGGESWHAATSALAGTSRLVGGDAYEPRILTRSMCGPWPLASAAVSRRTPPRA